MFSVRSVCLSYSFQQSTELMTFYISCENNYTYKSMNLQMHRELHRLFSFNNLLWKPLLGKHSASSLAHIGFYYSGNQAVVICYKCSCPIDCSDLSESLSVKHRQLSPNCLLVIGTAADNILLVHPEEVRKRFSADESLLDTADKNYAQTVATSLQSSSVELLLKTLYAVFIQAYSRSQKRGVFPVVDADITPVDCGNPSYTSVDNTITPIDRSNPDFDRLRYDSDISSISATCVTFCVFSLIIGCLLYASVLRYYFLLSILSN